MKDTKAIYGVMDADLQCLGNLLKTIPVIIKHVKEFNGKVLNVRLSKAINADLNGIGSLKITPNEYNTSKIRFYLIDRAVKYTDFRGNSSWIYSDWFGNYILYCDSVFDTKRIDSEKIIPYLEKFDTYCRDQIKFIKSDKKKFNSLIVKRNALKEKISQFNDAAKSMTGRDAIRLSIRN